MKKRKNNKLVWLLLLILVVVGLYGCGFLDGAIEEGKAIFEDVTSVPDIDNEDGSDSEENNSEEEDFSGNGSDESVSEDLQKLYKELEEAYNKDKDAEVVVNNFEDADQESDKEPSLDVVANMNFHELDGKGKNYVFTYNGNDFTAIYTTDNWKVIDSYLIEDEADITAICGVLIAEHPVHGKDMKSYRTADDMAYEWLQHNLAYTLLPEGNRWKVKAKDVDLNPADQGLSFDEIYEQQTGKKLTLDEIMKYLDK